jgi:hypothetical protein
MDLTLKAPKEMRWKEASNGVKISEPGFLTAGYDMRLVYIPARKTMRLAGETRVIVNLLEGALARPVLEAKDCAVLKQNREITAERDSLVFLCVDEGETETMNGDIRGLSLEWIEPTTGCYRTDPKIEIGNYHLNLWYLVPHKNGGIHNHAEQQGHNLGEQFIEFHTQLRGKGWMVKYKEQEEKTEYERYELTPGKTHPLFSKMEDGKVYYPWHAYVASETGALFIAFEEVII